MRDVALDALVVLAHLMDRNGQLSDQSRERANTAASIAISSDCPIICMGWNYRSDCNICVSEAVATHLNSVCGIREDRIILDRASRDTVGDAILSKRIILDLIGTDIAIAVVTSDYHVERTKRVFEFVYGNTALISVTGAPSDAGDSARDHEAASMAAFRKTFASVSPGDDAAILNALIDRHPYYNGKIYPKFHLT